MAIDDYEWVYEGEVEVLETLPMARRGAGAATASCRTAEGSPAYRRMLEELSHFLAPHAAQQTLEICLERQGIAPSSASSYDFREMLIGRWLPGVLADALRPDVLTEALKALDEAIVQMQSPQRAP